MDGKLHIYHPKRHLTLFEYRLSSSTITSDIINLSTIHPAKNVLLFIGGLYDNFLSPSYVSELASLFPINLESSPSWTVMHVQLSSANVGWGISNLDRDVDQIATAVEYARKYVVKEHGHSSSEPGPKLREEDVNFVLMGHSTGCQDVLHYLHSSIPPGKKRPPIQGAILQAPVSDREAALYSASKSSSARDAYEDLLCQSRTVPSDDMDSVILPMKQTKMLFGPTPISISRFLSLTSPDSPHQPSADDMFSSDLTEERLRATFGKVGVSPAFRVVGSASNDSSDRRYDQPSMLIMISGADEHMPDHVDKKVLLQRWSNALEYRGNAVCDVNSGIIEEGKHDLSGDDMVATKARTDMKQRVLRYLERVSGCSVKVEKELSLDDVGKALSESKEGQELLLKKQVGKL
jgi:Protein of unknown function (DUF1749)